MHRKHVDIAYEEDTATDLIQFATVAVCPTPTDNCAISKALIQSGTRLVEEKDGVRTEFLIKSTILEGHRFCYRPIRKGEFLQSWQMPFGVAMKDIECGEYVCNQSIIDTLSQRPNMSWLPQSPNFEDYISELSLDDFKAMEELPEHEEDFASTFNGFSRMGRGVGTRNFITVIGLTSRISGFVRLLEKEIQKRHLLPMTPVTPDSSILVCREFPMIDGMVSIFHTEGGTQTEIHNADLILRTMAGFVVHPNNAAVLVIDSPPPLNAHESVVGLDRLERYMRDGGFPLDLVHRKFYNVTGDFNADVDHCIDWLAESRAGANVVCREPVPISALSIALQCGGSDAFSGISGNPLSGLVSREIIMRGGSAVLAETDELMGAEQWIVKACKNMEVAKEFETMINRFKAYCYKHGHSPEGNPSGGNKLRGLYNISLKSLGAAMKKPADVRLEGTLEYGERSHFKKGYYFMDSPGNDLESIAGQVATGCQIIFFITGNGSITNFPFVPTIKIVTTSRRFELLQKDMDFNAGRYLDGISMNQLTQELLKETLAVANGKRSVGEKANHSQVSIWRNWPQAYEENQKDLGKVEQATQQESDRPTGVSLNPFASVAERDFDDSTFQYSTIVDRHSAAQATRKIGLLLPTSICSSTTAELIAKNLNEQLGRTNNANDNVAGISSFVHLPHTEGCGNSAGTSEKIYARTMLNYLRSPMVGCAVLLEHGCEKTHNDFMRLEMARLGMHPDDYGFASVQLDGGIEAVTARVKSLFLDSPATSGYSSNNAKFEKQRVTGLVNLRIGLMAQCAEGGNFSEPSVRALSTLALLIASHGGLAVLPRNSPLLSSSLFVGSVIDQITDIGSLRPTLSYGERPTEIKGLHIMETFTDNWTETLTGLCATGVELVIIFSECDASNKYVSGHPFVPTIRIATTSHVERSSSSPLFDLVLSPSDPSQWCSDILEFLRRYLNCEIKELKLNTLIDFQITRGTEGIST